MGIEDMSLPVSNSGPSAAFHSYVDISPLLSVTVGQSAPAVLVIHVTGELDMLTGPRLEEHLNRLLAARPERLIVDLGKVSFLGSNGLAVLIGARHAAAQLGTTLQLSGISHRAVARPLALTGLDRLFETSPHAPPATELS